jgi:hypothetical protein
MTIALCCSTKFKKQARTMAKQLRNLGFAVYEPPLPSLSDWDQYSYHQKYFTAAGLTHNHFYKIRKCDAIYVLNVDGYIGVSVTMEIAYAAALNKKIFFMEQDDAEFSRKVLTDGVAKSARELKQKLGELQTLDIID